MAEKFAVFPSADLSGNLLPTTLANVIPQATTTWSGLANATAYRGFVLRNPSAVFTPLALTAPEPFTIGMWDVDDAGTDGEALLTVSTLPANNGAPITGLQYRIGAGDPVNLPAATTGTYSITGLTNDAEVNVQVRAGNSAGFGDWSDTKAVTPTASEAGVPGAYTVEMWDVVDAQVGGTLTVTTNSEPDSGASDIIRTEYRISAGAAVTLDGPITGLTDDVAVDVQLRAVNDQGEGAWSDVKAVTPTTVAAAAPEAFGDEQWTVEGTGISGQARFTLETLPFDNNSVITDLEYRIGAGSAVSFGAATTGAYNVTGLTDGVEVSLQIRAVNAEGAGDWSDAKQATPFESAAPVISAAFDGTTLDFTTDTPGELHWSVTDAVDNPNGGAIVAGTGAYNFGSLTVLAGSDTATLSIPESPDVNTTGVNGLKLNLVLRAIDTPDSNIVRPVFDIAPQSSIIEDDEDILLDLRTNGLVEGTGDEEGLLVQWTDASGNGHHFVRTGTTYDVPFNSGHAELGYLKALRTAGNGFAKTQYEAGGFAVFIVAERTVSNPSGETVLWAENNNQDMNNSWGLGLLPNISGDGSIRTRSRRFGNAHDANAGSVPAAEYERFVIGGVFHPAASGKRGRVNINGRYNALNESGDVDTASIPQANYKMTLGGRINDAGTSQGTANEFAGAYRYLQVYATKNITDAHFEAVMEELGGKFSITIGS